MLGRLYEKWGITDSTNFSHMKPEDYPVLSDLYELIKDEYEHYDAHSRPLYTAELLQEILLGLHSMCVGAESKFFNGIRLFPLVPEGFQIAADGVRHLS